MEPSVTPRRRLRAALSTVVLGAAVAVLAGCGTVGHTSAGGDSQRGKQLFVDNCGSCHTLADAGTKGTIGPDLDDAFRQSREAGLGQSTIAQVVRGQIAYPIVDPPTEQPGMPADIVTGRDADDVASYVADVAGLEPAAAPPPAAPPPAEPGPPPPPAGPGDALAEGKQVFESAGCATCHTLADAGASGTVGPNLDDAMPSKELAVDRVTNGGGAMPPFAGQLTDEQIEAVATYVSTVAGK